MIVLISPEIDLNDEMDILNLLFKAGLEYFHLRKPNKNLHEHRHYLDQIDERFHNRIVIHYFHELIDQYNLKGVHYQEAKRRENDHALKRFITDLSDMGKTVSSSFHDPEELAQCKFDFNYHMLSPVFSSISKAGYEGKEFNVNHIDKQIIGLGGVTSKNLGQITSLGFYGVGVLGGIWNSPTPIEEFSRIKKYYKYFSNERSF
ncbi:thiamine phosphate synthase [Marinigracilibium pacificum]|uniref:Thiamine phosphate synthase n=1 Tax=Marinigracilibium pacificum TaxID=2729599 RepID=A0A848ITQ7_9BACT|nr:thiamine phosphate synthase [Marinigracilibium pacificum]NMM47727.1 thiamine phosphate synthase [Marinigracilibium pacificum]